MKTMLLLPSTWDLMKDASGNWATAAEPYAAAQDAASAIKLFQGEYWYDTSIGIPYFETTLGHRPPVQLLKAQNVAAALTVPDVTAALCFISSVKGRNVHGQVQVTTVSGQTAALSFVQ